LADIWAWLTSRREGKNARLANIVIGVFITCLLIVVARNYIFATQVHDALCTFQGDLSERIEWEEQVLANPAKFPEFNAPSTLHVFRLQLPNQQRNLASLDDLNCG
jgi:hypothetical protein